MRSWLVKLLLLGLLVVFGVLAIAAWWILPSRRAEVRLPPVATNGVPRMVISEAPIYRQKDQRWTHDEIGGSGERLGAVGCTICCLSMALSDHGIDLNPAELNQQLKDIDGYTFRGWVKWASVGEVSDNRIRIDLPQQPSNAMIEAALAEGAPVLVKVILKTGFQHWVLLVGRDGQEYLMKDPLGDGKQLAPLSTIGSDILAVRVVRKAEEKS